MPYTQAQETRLRAAAPITYADAGTLASEFGVSHRSVIAKVKSLGLDYVPKPTEPKRPRGMTKADFIALIANELDSESDRFAGLEKATGQSLNALLDALREAGV